MRLRLTVFPATAVVLGLILFSQVASTFDDANAVAVRLIVLNSAEDAQAILDRLKAGDDFAVLAREKSVDPTSADGGFLGKIDPTSLRAELRDALRGLQPGQLSKIVKIPSGYAVLKVLADTETADIENTDRTRQAAVLAQGSVRYDLQVAGLAEAQSALLQLPRPHDWGQDLHAVCEGHRQSWSTTMKQLDVLVDPANKESPLHDKNVKPLDVMQVYVAKSWAAPCIPGRNGGRRSNSLRSRIELPCRRFRRQRVRWKKCSGSPACTNPR